MPSRTYAQALESIRPLSYLLASVSSQCCVTRHQAPNIITWLGIKSLITVCLVKVVDFFSPSHRCKTSWCSTSSMKGGTTFSQEMISLPHLPSAWYSVPFLFLCILPLIFYDFLPVIFIRSIPVISCHLIVFLSFWVTSFVSTFFQMKLLCLLFFTFLPHFLIQTLVSVSFVSSHVSLFILCIFVASLLPRFISYIIRFPHQIISTIIKTS